MVLRFELRVLIIMIVLTLSTSQSNNNNCNNDDSYSLPCNPNIDPWKNTRTKMDTISAESDPPVFNFWTRAKYGKEKVDPIVAAATAYTDATKKKAKEAAEAATEAAEKVAEQAKGAAKWLKKGAKMMSSLATVVQFAGPILDIILLFTPLTKSSELTAIESGFAEMGARIDSVSYKIDEIQNALDWNAIVAILIEFEGSVDHLTEKYDNLVVNIKALDNTQKLPIETKNQIEDLVNAVRDTGNIGYSIKVVDNLFKGKSGFTNGKTLLEIFIEASGNDCSKILPMSNKLIKIMKDGQRLQYFYEINQQLVSSDDDKGYPKMIYDMYVDAMNAYQECTKSAASYAQKEMRIKHGNGEALIDIIDEMEVKYDLYNWASMKVFKKKKSTYAIIDNCASTSDVELTALSDDDKEKQQLTLYGNKIPSKTEVDDATGRVQTILLGLQKDDIPVIDIGESWSDSEAYRYGKLTEIRETLRSDSVLKALIDGNKLTMVLFESDTEIDLHGWHYKSNMQLLHRYSESNGRGSSTIKEEYKEFILGFIFNFREDTSNIKCNNGHRINLAFEGSHPFCVCIMGYGDTLCDMSLNTNPNETLSSSVLDLIQTYKVPGMFDLQKQVQDGTNEIMTELDKNKKEIFAEIQKTGSEIESSKNAVLSAQSVMLNDLKAGNAKVLQEVAGLRDALDKAFEKERNDRIYLTEKGNKIMIQAVGDANRKVTDDINRLTGKVIENRYFKELKLHIPVFQEKFENAIEYGGYAEDVFGEYMKMNEQDFLTSKIAAKKAVVETTDSFITAQMQINMVSGCTEDYTSMIENTWHEMFELNLAVATMEMWNLDYKIKKSSYKAEIEYFKYEQTRLKEKSKFDSAELKDVYENRSCRAFSLKSLIGGGCAKSTSYAGQTIPTSCSDSSKTLVLASTGQPISDLICGVNSHWTVDVNDLACVAKCQRDERYYEIGDEILLGAPPSGYYFADENGNAVTRTVCRGPQEQEWNRPTGWSTIGSGLTYQIKMPEIALTIKTNSVIGSGDRISFRFLDDMLNDAGGMTIIFTNPMDFRLESCFPNVLKLQQNVPEGNEKVWKIYRDQISDEFHVDCNDVKVATFDIKTCKSTVGSVYNRDIDRVLFMSIDSASLSYGSVLMDCIMDDGTSGASYRGLVSTTISGRECQPWSSKTPNDQSFNENTLPDSGMTRNYCRKPDGRSDTVWCFNNLGTVPSYEDCNVPKCSTSGEELLQASWSIVSRVDQNECETTDFCKFGGVCTNTAGSFSCNCPSGYEVGPDGRCKDINECNHGNVGYTKCLVNENLGLCTNTDGSFRCSCLSGSYLFGEQRGKECRPCDCDKNGVTSSVCDGNTGSCLCNTNVGGARCDVCKPGFATYPYCTQCAPGYFNYPSCGLCNCANTGTTQQQCHPDTGTCLCKPNVGGHRCETCKPYYKNYPQCDPDVRDGTLSQWSEWTAFIDKGKCEAPSMTGYEQSRTRTRTCDDSTKNIHGRSCEGDPRVETETRITNNCRVPTIVYLDLTGAYHAGTTGSLWMKIRQGNVECTTNKPTWRKPGAGTSTRAGEYKESANGCNKSFNTDNSVQLWVYSNSKNAIYAKGLGVRLGDHVWKRWSNGSRGKVIDRSHNNGWYTAS